MATCPVLSCPVLEDTAAQGLHLTLVRESASCRIQVSPRIRDTCSRSCLLSPPARWQEAGALGLSAKCMALRPGGRGHGSWSTEITGIVWPAPAGVRAPCAGRRGRGPIRADVLVKGLPPVRPGPRTAPCGGPTLLWLLPN